MCVCVYPRRHACARAYNMCLRVVRACVREREVERDEERLHYLRLQPTMKFLRKILFQDLEPPSLSRKT